MKQTLTRIFQLSIALLVGALATTVYIQHREIAQLSQVDWSTGFENMKPIPTPKATPFVNLFQFGDTTRDGANGAH